MFHINYEVGDKRHCSKIIAKNVGAILFQKANGRQKLTEKKQQFVTVTLSSFNFDKVTTFPFVILTMT